MIKYVLVYKYRKSIKTHFSHGTYTIMHYHKASIILSESIKYVLNIAMANVQNFDPLNSGGKTFKGRNASLCVYMYYLAV